MARTSLEGKIENVDLDKLQVDASYQRGVKPHHRKIAADFNPAAAGILHVGRRHDGSLWLIDGQQRREAMLKANLKTWKAIVIQSDGPRYEAIIFKLLNGRDTRKGLNPVELFKACLVANDPVALAVVRAVEAAGLRLKTDRGGSRGWPELACCGGLYRECQRYGEESVARALKDMATAWPGMDDVMSLTLPISMCKLYGRLGSDIDSVRMARTLASVPPRKILLESATHIGNHLVECQQVLLRIYNRGRRKNKLRLHGSDEEAA